MPIALLLAGCLLDRDGYEAARALLTDDDHDDYSEQDGDCDDNQASVFPGAFDGCDDLDNDCDGVTDEDGGTTTWYPDRDADGFGNEAEVSTACVAPAGWVDLGGDCDDTRRSTNPEATETCDGMDEDCDGATDESAADGQTWYVDADGDDFVAALEDSVSACTEPDGYSAVSSELDCDDSDSTVYPDAPEVCGDGVVNACGEVADCRYSGLNSPTSAILENDLGGGLILQAVGELSGDDATDLVLGHYEFDDDALASVFILDGPVEEGTLASDAAAVWDLAGTDADTIAIGFADSDVYPDLVVNSDAGIWRLDGGGGVVADQPAWLVADGSDIMQSVAFGQSPPSAWVALTGESLSRVISVGTRRPDGTGTASIDDFIDLQDRSSVESIAVCDLDGDGGDEVAFAPSDTVAIFAAADVAGSTPNSAALAVIQTSTEPLLSCAEDIDGDGHRELFVIEGAAEAFGAVTTYVISGVPADGSVEAAASFETEGPGYLGVRFDVGDLDDDGVLDLAVGSVDADFADLGGGTAGTDGGCAVVFYGPFTTGTRSATDADSAAFCSSKDDSYFGFQVAMASDITGDGLDDLVSTAPLETASDGVSQGIVYAIPGLTQ